MKKLVLGLISVFASSLYAMHPEGVHLLTVEGKQTPKAFTSPIALEKIPSLNQKETVALYVSGLNVIVSGSYENFRMYFSALPPRQQGVVFSYVTSFLAERSNLQIENSIATGSVMSRSKKSEIYDDISVDNKLVSEFVESAWNGKKISWEIFLGDSLEKTLGSLDVKLNKPEFLSGEKEYIDLTELNRPERKLLMAWYSLDLLKGSKKGCVDSMIEELKNFQDLLDLFQSLNPYHYYLGDISIAGLGFRDYKNFFNYESLIKLSTVLYVVKGLNGSGIGTTVSIGQLTDNLREFIKCFLSYGFDKENENLFIQFVKLKENFPDFD